MLLAAVAATTVVMTACSTSDDAGTRPDPPPAASATATAGWRDEVAALCSDGAPGLAAIRENDGTPASIAAEATATKAVFEGGITGFGSIAVPDDVQPTLDQVLEMGDEAIGYLDASIEAADAGDTARAQQALDEGSDRLSRTATAWAMAGASCASDPARVQNADLTVPLEMHSEHATAAFDSIWVSEHLASRVVRLDPDTGNVQAAIDVGDKPLRLQPADGSMWVRTASSYVEVDPDTNDVTRTLAKADVGPAANRSWAVDGAMWICDGRRLHRYDPTSLAATATLDLELECGTVWADDDLVVAWTYNEDEGESGTSAAAFVDPTTNTVLATVPLPVDVGGPVALPDAVFFPGYGGSTAVIVDRATWTVSATPDLGVAGGGEGQPAFDGESIYFGNADHQDVVRVDSATFTVTDTIEPLGVNAVLVDGGSLWIARGQPHNVVQRFDIDQG
jgi:hypothetical protein